MAALHAASDAPAMITHASTKDLAAIELSIGDGEVTPLHVHGVDESFRVLEGTLAIHVGGHVVHLGPGATYTARAGMPHAVGAPARGARYVVASRVHSVGDYRDFQRAVAVPDSLPATDDDIAVVAELARENGITVLGPPGVLPDRLAA